MARAARCATCLGVNDPASQASTMVVHPRQATGLQEIHRVWQSFAASVDERAKGEGPRAKQAKKALSLALGPAPLALWFAFAANDGHARSIHAFAFTRSLMR